MGLPCRLSTLCPADFDTATNPFIPCNSLPALFLAAGGTSSICPGAKLGLQQLLLQALCSTPYTRLIKLVLCHRLPGPQASEGCGEPELVLLPAADAQINMFISFNLKSQLLMVAGDVTCGALTQLEDLQLQPSPRGCFPVPGCCRCKMLSRFPRSVYSLSK